ncbi:MAG: exodeoxyribonuclease VII large subunit [Mariprofundaceae bacterium]
MDQLTLPQKATPISVTELTAGIKQLLEQKYAKVEVVGEVSRLTKHASGHFYFTVKDKHASISAVIWRSAAMRLKQLPEEGKAFVFSGHISLYEPQGRYQLVIRKVEAVGAGQLAEEFEKRKALFAEQGWFDADRKQSLPSLPKHIGIITSPTAAAFEDVKKVLSTRPAWLKLSLSPCIVQGNTAPETIAKAIHRLHAMENKPDVLLLVRGGGSLEDLWCFNDEIVVQAIVNATIPIISGIGHEIDTTLSDLAADLRAATPSNAAELVCADKDTLRNQLPRLSLLERVMRQRLTHAHSTLEKQHTSLLHHWQLDQDKRHLHIERASNQISDQFRQLLHQQRKRIHVLTQRLSLQEPRARLKQRQHILQHEQQRLFMFQTHGRDHEKRQLENLQQKLTWLSDKNIESKQQILIGLGKQLMDLGPMQVMQRGYTLTLNKQGQPITSSQSLQIDDTIHIRFHDGHVETQVKDVKMENHT